MAINAKNILLFTTGQLGDTLASVPSILSIRNFFPDSRITLLYDKHVGKHYVSAPDVLKGLGLVDDFLYYPFYKSKIVHAINIDNISTLLRLRALKYDTLVYLAPSRCTNYQIKRDIGFFHLDGIKQFIGTEGFLPLPEKTLDQPLPQIPHEGDQFLSRHPMLSLTLTGGMMLCLFQVESSLIQYWEFCRNVLILLVIAEFLSAFRLLYFYLAKQQHVKSKENKTG